MTKARIVKVKTLAKILSVGVALLLGACGGGEGGDVNPASPPPSAVSVSHWVPQSTDTWQWQLRGTVNTTYAVNVYDIDLFDTPQGTINALKASGKRVVCYFSAGSAENWRPDFTQFKVADLGSALAGWTGENWVDTRSANVRTILKARLDLAKTKGCDGVEPDNVDGYNAQTGFPLTATTQLDFNNFLALEAHARGLAIALKNDVAQIAQLVSVFDFAVNEQCFSLGECAGYAAFTQQGKAVFNAEYGAQYQTNVGGARDLLCTRAQVAKIHTLVLPLQLDDTFRYSCG